MLSKLAYKQIRIDTYSQTLGHETLPIAVYTMACIVGTKGLRIIVLELDAEPRPQSATASRRKLRERYSLKKDSEK